DGPADARRTADRFEDQTDKLPACDRFRGGKMPNFAESPSALSEGNQVSADIGQVGECVGGVEAAQPGGWSPGHGRFEHQLRSHIVALASRGGRTVEVRGPGDTDVP